jgi:hypothetical protein
VDEELIYALRNSTFPQNCEEHLLWQNEANKSFIFNRDIQRDCPTKHRVLLPKDHRAREVRCGGHIKQQRNRQKEIRS